MSMRLRRLTADYEQISTVFGSNGPIRIVNALGSPPEKYHVEFLVAGLQADPNTGQIHAHNQFLAEIALTAAYPRMAPQCKMVTPVFHPNIAPHAICIGDHWAAGESLAHLLVRIAEMLTYQSYNLKSPLNGEAAKWVEQNMDKLPLDTTDFAASLSIGEVVGRNADGTLKAGGECANCGKHGDAKEMHVCVNQHVACDDCVLHCPTCQRLVCLKCSLNPCAICGRQVCAYCLVKCGSCGRLACREHVQACHVCNLGQCQDCVVECSACHRPTCIQHLVKVSVGGRSAYECVACRQGATHGSATGTPVA